MLSLHPSHLQPIRLETSFPSINARYDSNTAEVIVRVNGYQSGRVIRNGISWEAISQKGMEFSLGDKVHIIGKVRHKLILVIGPSINSHVQKSRKAPEEDQQMEGIEEKAWT